MEFEKMTPQYITKKASALVEQYLAENMPAEYVVFGDGSFTYSHGSATVMIVVRPFTEQNAVVEFSSQVVSGARIDAELMEWLLRKNTELHFGAFGLLFDGTIIYSYSLPAADLDAREFLSALNAVSVIADYYDDEIVTLAGGKRASEQEIADLTQ